MLCRFLLVFGLFCITGCTSTPRYVFDVQVANQTHDLIHVGLVKRVPPGQAVVAEWTGPEHVAMGAPQLLGHKWGTALKAGEGVTFGSREADFSDGTYLRAYRSDGTTEELLGFTQDDPGRADVPIYPGRNSFEIVVEKGRLSARSIGWNAAAPVEKRK